jgi:PAS domain-containing protein
VVRLQLAGVTTKEAARVLAETGSWLGEFVQSRRDGSTFPSEATTTDLMAAQGRITGYVRVNRETSERVRAADLASLPTPGGHAP